MSPVDVSWPKARALAHATGAVLGSEVVGIPACVWRRAAGDVRALTSLPPFDASAMDGWAVAGSGPWRVVGSSRAGGRPAWALTEGEALEVTTGSALAPGATAVLRCEHGRIDDVGLLHGAITPGQDIRHAGEELRAGSLVARAGTLLDPVLVGLVAAVGHDEVSVVRRPRVRVLVLGDELLRSGPAREGRVRDSLGPQLPAWLDAWGCELTEVRHVPDTAAAQREAVASRDDSADVVVTTGGTSVGPADFVRDALEVSGGHLVVSGVDCRPGHPMLLGHWHDRWLVGLPGNPHAAVAALLTLLDPLLLALHGVELPPLQQVRLAERVSPRGAGTRLVPCTLDAGSATPASGIGSGMLRGLAQADGLAVVPASAALEDLVGWLPLPWTQRRGGGLVAL